jgi:hypothetical protein
MSDEDLRPNVWLVAELNVATIDVYYDLGAADVQRPRRGGGG